MLQTDPVFNMMRLDISFLNEHLTELFPIYSLLEKSGIKLLAGEMTCGNQDFSEPDRTGSWYRRLLISLKHKESVQLLLREQLTKVP